MNKIQRLQDQVTRDLLENEIWLYGGIVTGYKKMRKYVNRYVFDKKDCIRHFKYLENQRNN